MVKLAELFEERFDSVEQGDDGVSLICAECGTVVRNPLTNGCARSRRSGHGSCRPDH